MVNKRWFKLLAWMLCIVIAIGLVCLVYTDRKKNEERAILLQQEAAEREQTDNQKLEAYRVIYDRFASQLELPSIICWGDSAMAGSDKASLPISLENAINNTLFSELSKTFNKVFEQEGYSIPSITINNMGVVNENMRQILVRAGVNTMEIGDWIKIPADTDPIEVMLKDEEAWNSTEKDAEIKFAKQSDVDFGKVWISDIEGTLIATDDWFDNMHPRYAFVRDEEGDSKSVGAGTEVEIESATRYIGDIPVFFFENDSGRSTEGFVSDISRLVDRYANTKDEDDEEETSYELPFVVICTTKEGSDLDKALEEAFGSRYVRNDSSKKISLSTLAKQVYDNLDEQGSFDDVKAKIALALNEANNL